MKSTKCDYCNEQLDYSDGITKYRLNLSCQYLPHIGGIVLDMYIYPPLDNEVNFCGFGCLKKWIENK